MCNHIHYGLSISYSTYVVPTENALEDESSIFGQTGISCLSVRAIDFFVVDLYGLSFFSALGGARRQSMLEVSHLYSTRIGNFWHV